MRGRGNMCPNWPRDLPHPTYHGAVSQATNNALTISFDRVSLQIQPSLRCRCGFSRPLEVHCGRLRLAATVTHGNPSISSQVQVAMNDVFHANLKRAGRLTCT